MDHHPEIPGYVEQALAQAGLDRKQVRAAAHTDLDRQGSFRAAWLCVDDHALYIFAQTKRGKEPRRVVPFIKKRDKGQFFAGIDDRNFSGEMELIEHYDLEMLKSLRCEYFVGSIAVIATIGEDEDPLPGIEGQRSGLERFLPLGHQSDRKIRASSGRWQAAAGGALPQMRPPLSRSFRPICPNCIDKRTLFKRVLALHPNIKSRSPLWLRLC